MRWVPLLVLVVFLGTIFVPQWINEKSARRYAQPLFDHPIPENAQVISTDAAKDDDGGITGAILLKTNWTSEALETFYSDLQMDPAKEGQTVVLHAKALTEEDLEVLQQAKLYEEGASYQFVYIYSGT